jgi:acetylornithine/N-succinyldiaminopimelate aminotransferase
VSLAYPVASLFAGEASLMPVYARSEVAPVRGSGARVWGADGREYLDVVGGLGALSLGHAHPRWVEAVEQTARTIGLTSNLFATKPQADLAARLADVVPIPDTRVFLCNSGAEANEALLKLVRRWGLPQGRPAIVALNGSFHGRTIATLAATGQPPKRAPFEPLVDWFRFVDPGDVEGLTSALAPGDVAAVFVEPVLGEGGVIPLPVDFIRTLRTLCDEHGALLAVDEVQAGAGRCGDWLSVSDAGVVPDVASFAKALGGGLPVGALVARAELSFAPGEHASTFGGGPIPCAAALAVLATIEDDDLLANVVAMGDLLRATIAECSSSDLVADIRGRGLLTGVQFVPEIAAADIVRAMLGRGVLASTAGPHTVRFTPPYIIRSDEIEAAAVAFGASLEELAP